MSDGTNIPVEMKHVGWVCRTCGKTDWKGEEAQAKPEHVPYRGVDIGRCPGKMVKLYANEEAWHTLKREYMP